MTMTDEDYFRNASCALN